MGTEDSGAVPVDPGTTIFLHIIAVETHEPQEMPSQGCSIIETTSSTTGASTVPMEANFGQEIGLTTIINMARQHLQMFAEESFCRKILAERCTPRAISFGDIQTFLRTTGRAGLISPQ